MSSRIAPAIPPRFLRLAAAVGSKAKTRPCPGMTLWLTGFLTPRWSISERLTTYVAAYVSSPTSGPASRSVIGADASSGNCPTRLRSASLGRRRPVVRRLRPRRSCSACSALLTANRLSRTRRTCGAASIPARDGKLRVTGTRNANLPVPVRCISKAPPAARCGHRYLGCVGAHERAWAGFLGASCGGCGETRPPDILGHASE